MIRSALFPLALLCAASALAQQPTFDVVVVPFAGLGGEATGRAGAKAAARLVTELKNADGLKVIEGKKAPPDPAVEKLTQARAGVEEGKARRDKHQLRAAEEALQGAVAGFRAGAAALEEVGEVVDAHALLAAVQYVGGKDEEGAKSLNLALGLAPDRPLPLAKTSPMFARVVEAARKAVKAAPRGTLTFESSPPRGVVRLDGLVVGQAPLRVSEVPPGLHLYQVVLPTGERVGGAVQLEPGKALKVEVKSGAADPAMRISAALAENKVGPELVTHARAVAQASAAQAVVVGAVSGEGQLSLDTFLVVVESGEVRRLPRTRFDSELLSAGTELFRLTTEMKEKGKGAGTVVTLPAAVAVEPQPSVRLSEVKYATTGGAAEQAPEPTRRVPLKKGNQ